MTAEPRPVVCVGETMAMVTPLDGMSLAVSGAFSVTPGGAESTVAAHLVALGVQARWWGRLGTDALGDRLVRALGDRGLDMRWVARDPVAPTGLYLKDPVPGAHRAVTYYRAGSAASRMSVDDLVTWRLADIGWAHLTGITPALSASCSVLTETIVDGGVPGVSSTDGYGVSFDVNYRPALWLSRQEAAARCLEIGRRCRVVFVGLDEAHDLWGAEDAEDVADLFAGVPSVVVKAGDVEAVEVVRAPSGRATVHRQPARRVEVVDPVGAGDAFAAGFLAGFWAGDEPEERLAAGHRLAAWTLGSVDDHRPHPETGLLP